MNNRGSGCVNEGNLWRCCASLYMCMCDDDDDDDDDDDEDDDDDDDEAQVPWLRYPDDEQSWNTKLRCPGLGTLTTSNPVSHS